MKTYDYKDETKDVKGKVIYHSYNLLDWTSQHSAGVAIVVAGLEKRYQPNHTQPGRSNADDWKEHFRPLPNVKKSSLGFAETGIDQEEEMDPAWPHL